MFVRLTEPRARPVLTALVVILRVSFDRWVVTEFADLVVVGGKLLRDCSVREA